MNVKANEVCTVAKMNLGNKYAVDGNMPSHSCSEFNWR